jgi:hypothetical protein
MVGVEVCILQFIFTPIYKPFTPQVMPFTGFLLQRNQQLYILEDNLNHQQVLNEEKTQRTQIVLESISKSEGIQ